jgi:hypothetical protein
MDRQSASAIIREVVEQETRREEMERLFSENDFEDILCDGRCATCMQREWCLLTPASRCVK